MPRLQGQVKIMLEMPEQVELPDRIAPLSPPAGAPDSASVADTLSTWLSAVREQGYWTASVENLIISDSIASGHLYVGPVYKYGYLNFGELPPELLDGTGLRSTLMASNSWSRPEILRIQDQMLAYAARHGYPFASAGLDSIRWSGSDLEAVLTWDYGPRIMFGQPVVEGSARISANYLCHYLGLMPDAPYDERLVRLADTRLRDLGFLTSGRETGIVFSGDRAVPYYFLDAGKASRFDFVLGLLPRTSSVAGDIRSTLLLTGTLEAELANAFGWGEQLSFRFEQLRPGTPLLSLSANYPYPAGLPVGLDVEFDLQKFDTTFITLLSQVGLQYLFSGGNSVKAFWRNETSNLLTIDEPTLRSARILPDVLDVRNTTFGLEYVRQHLDYRFNPRRGWRIQVKGAAGIKRVRRSRLIEGLSPADDGFEFGTLYDSLALRSAQYRLQGDLAVFLPLSGRSTVLVNHRFGWLLTDQPAFVNEQYRLGGHRLLRGFDEQSIFATRYAVMTLEFRVLLDRNSRLFLFTDIGYLEDVTVSRQSYDRPSGFGSGLTFDTPAGIFSITLAFGRRLSNPVDWAAPKIHFGYVSLF